MTQNNLKNRLQQVFFWQAPAILMIFQFDPMQRKRMRLGKKTISQNNPSIIRDVLTISSNVWQITVSYIQKTLIGKCK